MRIFLFLIHVLQIFVVINNNVHMHEIKKYICMQNSLFLIFSFHSLIVKNIDKIF